MLFYLNRRRIFFVEIQGQRNRPALLSDRGRSRLTAGWEAVHLCLPLPDETGQLSLERERESVRRGSNTPYLLQTLFALAVRSRRISLRVAHIVCNATLHVSRPIKGLSVKEVHLTAVHLTAMSSHSSSSPFQTMMDDNLRHIFALVVEPATATDQPLTGHNLAAVCRHWRDAAMLQKSLWTSVVLDFNRAFTPQSSLSYVYTMKERAGSLPLNLRVLNLTSSNAPLDFYRLFAALVPACGTIRFHIGCSCRSTFTMDPSVVEIVVTLKRVLEQPANRLTDAMFYTTCPHLSMWDVRPFAMLPMASRLRRLQLLGISFGTTRTLHWGNLTSLTLEHLRTSAVGLTTVIANHSSTLTDLTLRGVRIQNAGPVPALPLLCELSLHGVSMELFQHLPRTSLPRLSTLSLSGSADDVTYLEHFLQNRPLASLTVLRLGAAPRPSTLSRAMELLPALATLTLCGGFEAGYFSVLAQGMNATLAISLRILIVANYTEPYHSTRDLLAFLKRKAELARSSAALQSLDITGCNGHHVRDMPVLFSSFSALAQLCTQVTLNGTTPDVFNWWDVYAQFDGSASVLLCNAVSMVLVALLVSRLLTHRHTCSLHSQDLRAKYNLLTLPALIVGWLVVALRYPATFNRMKKCVASLIDIIGWYVTGMYA